MALNDSLLQINLGVQGGTQGILTVAPNTSDDPSSAELDLFKFLKICNGGVTVNWNVILQDGPDK
ncbi:UNVERIFIED_CONTAM: hypothetical protein NCL1_29059 [Trichonephila clavipes]